MKIEECHNICLHQISSWRVNGNILTGKSLWISKLIFNSVSENEEKENSYRPWTLSRGCLFLFLFSPNHMTVTFCLFDFIPGYKCLQIPQSPIYDFENICRQFSRRLSKTGDSILAVMCNSLQNFHIPFLLDFWMWLALRRCIHRLCQVVNFGLLCLVP